MKRFSRSDSSSITCSSSRRPSLDSSRLRRPGAAPNQRRHRRLDRGERRAQVVRQRVEQRRLELLVPPRRFRFAGALERAPAAPDTAARSRAAPPRASAVRRSARDASSPAITAVHDEGEELDPVLRIFDAEAGRRQEVVRIRAGAGRRRDQRRPGPPEPRDDDDVEQQQRRGDAGIADRGEAQHAPRSARRSRPPRRT